MKDDDCGLGVGDRTSRLCNGSLEFRKGPVPLAGHSQPSNVDAYLGRGVLLKLGLRQTITGRNDETDASFRVDDRTFLQPSAIGCWYSQPEAVRDSFTIRLSRLDGKVRKAFKTYQKR